jgi:hypothetical protein
LLQNAPTQPASSASPTPFERDDDSADAHAHTHCECFGRASFGRRNRRHRHARRNKVCAMPKHLFDIADPSFSPSSSSPCRLAAATAATVAARQPSAATSTSWRRTMPTARVWLVAKRAVPFTAAATTSQRA